MCFPPARGRLPAEVFSHSIRHAQKVPIHLRGNGIERFSGSVEVFPRSLAAKCIRQFPSLLHPSMLLQSETRIQFLNEKVAELQNVALTNDATLKAITDEKESINYTLASVKTSLEKLESDHSEIKLKYEEYFNQNNKLKDFILKIQSENEVLKEKNSTIKKEIEETSISGMNNS